MTRTTLHPGLFFALALGLLAACHDDGSGAARPGTTPGGKADDTRNPGTADAFPLGPDPVEIDVAGTNPVKLRLSVQSTGNVELPRVRVSNMYGGFECDILSLSLVDSVYESSIPALIKTYEITVGWHPGADSSGCTVEVVNPYTNSVHTAELYMWY